MPSFLLEILLQIYDWPSAVLGCSASSVPSEAPAQAKQNKKSIRSFQLSPITSLSDRSSYCTFFLLSSLADRRASVLSTSCLVSVALSGRTVLSSASNWSLSSWSIILRRSLRSCSFCCFSSFIRSRWNADILKRQETKFVDAPWMQKPVHIERMHLRNSHLQNSVFKLQFLW